MPSHACNLTLVGEIVTGSATLCDYGNYHVFMLVSCGLLALGCMIRATIQYTICHTPSHTVERTFFMGILFLIFALGFEAAFMLLLIVGIYPFIPCGLGKCEQHAKVAPSSPDIDTIEQSNRPASSVICPICLDSDGSPDLWFTTKCNHSFHMACINKWVKNSCPLCRKPLSFSKVYGP